MSHYPQFRWIAIFALVLVTCTQDLSYVRGVRGGGNPPELPPDIQGTTHTNSWTQPSSADVPIDLIFVEDTSSSLDDERVDVRKAIQSFLSAFLSRGIYDYCIGVMLG